MSGYYAKNQSLNAIMETVQKNIPRSGVQKRLDLVREWSRETQKGFEDAEIMLPSGESG